MANDDRDPPIENPPFIGGVNVVDIGEIRVARGLSRRAHSSCPHRHMLYDQSERRIWCRDCEKTIEPFDAFRLIAEQVHNSLSAIKKREDAVAAAESHALVSLAAKKLDDAWRRKKMVPACPHCNQGLFPEDFKRGVKASLGVEYARAMAERRKREKPNTNPPQHRG